MHPSSTNRLATLAACACILPALMAPFPAGAQQFAEPPEPAEITLSPASPSAFFPDAGQENRLAPSTTMLFIVTIAKTGRDDGHDYELSGEPQFQPGVDVGVADDLWTEGALHDSADQLVQHYLLTNASPVFAQATLTVSCVWTPVTGYGGSGPRPDDIPGSAYAQAYLEQPVVDWQFERHVAVYNLIDHFPGDRQLPFTVSFEDTAGRFLSSDHITNVNFSFVDDPPAPQGGGNQPMGSSQGSGLFVQVDVPLNPQSNEMSAHVDALDPEQGGAGTPQITVNNNDPVAYDAGVNAAPAVIVNAAGEPSDTLGIAKMEHSLKADGSLVIDDDEDRFYVRVRNAGGHAQGSIVISTIDNPDAAYNNPEVRMTLHPDGDDMVTESMILVADTVDDEYPGLNGEVGANNEDDDRSHLIQLEGSVLVSEVELGANVLPADIRATVEVEDTVHLNVVVFNGSGTTVQAIQDEIDGRVRERFAQIGIEVTREVNAADWNTPLWGTPVGFHVRRVGDDGLYVPDQVLNLINHFTNNVDPNTITAFVVLEIHAFDEDEVSRPRGGVAFHRSITWEYLETPFRNCFFVAGSARPWIFAHELGHMTTDKVHYGETYPEPKPPQHKIAHNLMRAQIDTEDQSPTAPKRLYRLQKGNAHHQDQP